MGRPGDFPRGWGAGDTVPSMGIIPARRRRTCCGVDGLFVSPSQGSRKPAQTVRAWCSVLLAAITRSVQRWNAPVAGGIAPGMPCPQIRARHHSACPEKVQTIDKHPFCLLPFPHEPISIYIDRLPSGRKLAHLARLHQFTTAPWERSTSVRKKNGALWRAWSRSTRPPGYNAPPALTAPVAPSIVHAVQSSPVAVAGTVKVCGAAAPERYTCTLAPEAASDVSAE